MKVEWTIAAQKHREAIWHFLSDRSLDYADRVDERIRLRAEMLVIAPLQGPQIGSGLRKLSIPDVQYVIHYRVDEDAIRIMRVFSTRLDREDQ